MGNTLGHCLQMPSDVCNFPLPHWSTTCVSLYVPSGNQTWQWKIHYLYSDFPIESPISSGFPIATFEYRRVVGELVLQI